MGTVQRWSGREARALREALRMSVRAFAAHLGVSDRTVSKWEAGGEQLFPVPDSQALLDTVLDRADPDAVERFREILGVPDPRRATTVGSYALAPSPEHGLVHRSEDFESVISLLSTASSAGRGGTVAVCGPGGFGKTTLITQVCEDAGIRELYPEILWVETGEGCTSARVVELISDLCVHLDGARPALTDPEQAGFHLARLLQGRRALLVIDNVWSAADLSPFLLGAPECVRLVTTRNIRTYPSTAQVLRLGPMSGSEISELLTRAVSPLARPAAEQLAALCGGWPLLASVVGSNVSSDLAAGSSPEQAVSEARETLHLFGPHAFDVWDADQRSNAIGHAITASLRSLDDGVRIPGASSLRERYLSLAVFPAAAPIPLSVLTHWWRADGWSAGAVRQFCRVLADRSLIGAYLADRNAIVLHDIFRAYLKHLVGEQWEALHRSLVDSYRAVNGGEWTRLPASHSYLWHRLPYHLREAGLADELLDVLSSVDYVVTKAATVGSQALATDASLLGSLPALQDGSHLRHSAWRRARTLTESGYLLGGLQRKQDMAATLTLALVRAGFPPGISAKGFEEAEGFEVSWARPAGVSGTTPGHVGAVVSVATAAGLVCSGGEDGTVQARDLTTGRLLNSFRGHTGWVFAVALTQDGTLLASAGDDGAIRLWHPRSGEVVGVLAGHDRRVRGLAFAPTGKHLVSVAEDGRARVWDVERQTLSHSLSTCGTPLWTVSVNDTATVVATAGEDEFVRLYDLASGALLDEKAAHRDWVRSVAFSPSGTLLASGSGDRSVALWNTDGSRLKLVRRVDGLPSRVRAVAATERSGLLVATTEDAVVRTFDTAGPGEQIRMPAGVDWVRGVVCTPDGAVAAACEDGSVRLWKPDRPNELRLLADGLNTVWSTQIAGDRALGVVGHGDGSIELLDLATAALHRELDGGAGRVWSVAAGDGLVAAACGDGAVRVWSLSDESWSLRLNDDIARSWGVALPQMGSCLAASTGDGRIRCWDLPSGTLRWERQAHAGRIRSLAFDAVGDLLVAAGGDGTVHVWNARNGQHVTRFVNPGGWARVVAVDSSGTRLAVGSGTGEIHVRDLRSEQFTAHLTGHAGRVLMVAFSEDRDRLVSAAADGTVRAWSLGRQQQLAEVRADAALNCAAADAGGAHVLVGSAVGPALLRFGDHTLSTLSQAGAPRQADSGPTAR
ncbi:NB-ARC domain-containing protein [Kitasatospora sp. NPDC088134]|uniref:NB-ARC domain-containing protein n=1 Tax=Kitasatospora sp. NPDC088134 TaxID=3364071 RepID=UPI0037F9355B